MMKAFKLYIRSIKLWWNASGYVLGSVGINQAINAICPFIPVYFFALIINELSTNQNVEAISRLVIQLIILTTIFNGLKVFTLRLRNKYTNFQSLHILFTRQTTQKMFSLDYELAQSEQVKQMRNEIESAFRYMGLGHRSTVKSFGNLVFAFVSLITGIAFGIVSFSGDIVNFTSTSSFVFGGIIVLSVVLAVVFLVVVASKRSSMMSEVFAGMKSINRAGLYYFAHAYNIERHKDLRFYNQLDINKYYGNKANIFAKNSVFMNGVVNKYGIVNALQEFVSFIVMGGVYIATVYLAFDYGLNIGALTIIVNALMQCFNAVSIFVEAIITMVSNAEYLEKHFEFMDLENEMYQGSLTTEKRADRSYNISFENVKFTYPGEDKTVLDDISIELGIGKRIAIVGENGSGKTTFIKLLTRLYDVSEGVIKLNNIDIKKYKYSDYLDLFSVVFQDFNLISAPIGQNIASSSNINAEQIISCFKDVGFEERYKMMKDGLDTILYKEANSNGIDVSKGEEQKLAIARALYKDAPFIIMDEPTASLDAIAETEIYERMNEIITDKTAIYISHRLSSCKFCDEILVFHKGKIVQRGAHHELVNIEGKYQELWNAQAKYYSN